MIHSHLIDYSGLKHCFLDCFLEPLQDDFDAILTIFTGKTSLAKQTVRNGM